MSQEKKGPGRPTKEKDELASREKYTITPENLKRIKNTPQGKRSQLVNNALDLYFKVLDGKVKFVETSNQDLGEMDGTENTL